MREIIPTQILCKEPLIAVFDSNLSSDVLEFLISYPINQRGEEPRNFRNGFVLYTAKSVNGQEILQTTDFIFLTDLIVNRIKEVLDITYTEDNIEPLQVAHYPTGGFLGPHRDFMRQKGEIVDERYRDRIATVILYVNDDYEGGVTMFDELDLVVQPKKGQILYFEYNPLKNSIDTNMKTLHSGTEITKGEKRLVVQFIRENKHE
jgi:hypothetical protein